jgi:hypothetical protein
MYLSHTKPKAFSFLPRNLGPQSQIVSKTHLQDDLVLRAKRPLLEGQVLRRALLQDDVGASAGLREREERKQPKEQQR